MNQNGISNIAQPKKTGINTSLEFRWCQCKYEWGKAIPIRG